MTAIYTTLFTAIQSRLETVTAVKAIYPYPTETVEKYPAAIYFPDAFENAFQSTIENEKTIHFKLFVVVGSTQKDKYDIFNTVLPNAVDTVISAFDAEWDVGTIDGHRVRVLISSGSWTMAQSPQGIEAQAELTVEFKLLTEN